MFEYLARVPSQLVFPGASIHLDVDLGLAVLFRFFMREVVRFVLGSDFDLRIGLYLRVLFGSSLVAVVGAIPQGRPNRVRIVVERNRRAREILDWKASHAAANLAHVVHRVISDAQVNAELPMMVLATAGKLSECAGNEERMRIDDLVAQKIRWNRLRFELEHRPFQLCMHGFENRRRRLARRTKRNPDHKNPGPHPQKLRTLHGDGLSESPLLYAGPITAPLHL